MRTLCFALMHIQGSIDRRYTMQSHLLRYLLGPIILLALSDALFHHPLYLPRQWQLLPMLPYSSILHAIFKTQPLYHEYAEDHLIQRGNIDNRNNQQDQVDAGSNTKRRIEYPDAQLRVNKQDSTQRYLFGGSTFTNPFWKTATYTSVSTLNVTSVQNCIPASLFAVGSTSVRCRRKKREIPSEDVLQFPSDPSKPQQLTVTVLPSIDLPKRNGRQHQTTLVSSKDEVIPNEEWQERQDLTQEERFFHYHHYYVASTTVYSYVLSTIVTLHTIYPLNAGSQQQVLCLLNGYVVC